MTDSTDNTVPLAAARAVKAGRCPICGRPAAAETRPFCSRRCKDVDLARWLGEVYRIPEPDPGTEKDAPAAPDDGD